MAEVREHFPGVFFIKDKIAVKNIIRGFRPFSEELAEIGGEEYRLWDPNRSKAAAAIAKGIKEFPIGRGTKILYLGIAHGYTASFLSCVVGKSGMIYGVEISERTFRELMPIAAKYGNIAPMLADARNTDLYGWIEPVDVVYEDVADTQQTDIGIRNCRRFLKKGGYFMLSIKTRSIDVTKSPKKIVEQEIQKVKDAGFFILDWKMLDPLERDHGFVVARMK